MDSSVIRSRKKVNATRITWNKMCFLESELFNIQNKLEMKTKMKNEF